MPLCNLQLISLSPSTPIPVFLSLLSSHAIKPLVASKVIRWIITPQEINANELLHPPHPWDLLLILPGTDALPEEIKSKTRNTFSLTSGIPSRLVTDFAAKNKTYLHPDPSSVPPVSPSDILKQPDPSKVEKDSQNLTLSPDLLDWARSFYENTPVGTSPVSMLNLLAFHPTEAAKQSYLAYGAAFSKTIGSRHGGNAKIVGHAVYPDHAPVPDSSDWKSAAKAASSSPKWNEIAIAQYPSIAHFAAMLNSKDYQDVNARYRVPSLRDTCILCTSEVAVEEMVKEWGEKEHDRGTGVGYMAKL